MTECVYVFLDESGNLDFSPIGTKYFVLTSMMMARPFRINCALDRHLYDCIDNGIDIEYFHCYNDSKRTRRSVFDLMTPYLGSIDIDCLILEKSTMSADLRTGSRFYPAMFRRLINLAMRSRATDTIPTEVVIITDTVPINRGRRAVEKAIRTALATALPNVQHRSLHHQSRSHYGLQIADYCSWAIFRKWEVGDDSWFAYVEPAMRQEITIIDEK